MFIKSETPPTDEQEVQVFFEYDKEPYYFRGQVIHHARIASLGFGVKFNHDSTMKKSAKTLARTLMQHGKLQVERAPTERDTFRWWAKQLLKSGQGLIPGARRPPYQSPQEPAAISPAIATQFSAEPTDHKKAG